MTGGSDFAGADADGFSLTDAIGLSGVSRETLPKLQIYATLLGEWSPRLNLIGPAERMRFNRRHMLDSLQLVRWIHDDDRDIADLGSGAGLPGVPLACALDGARDMRLVEKSPKKAMFLRVVSERVGCGLGVLNQRMEEAPLVCDVVVSRAVARLDRLLDVSSRWLRPTGRALFLKGELWEQELTEAAESWSFRLETAASLSGGEGRVMVFSQIGRRE